MIRIYQICLLITLFFLCSCTEITKRDEALQKINVQLDYFYAGIENKKIDDVLATIHIDSTHQMAPLFSDDPILEGEDAVRNSFEKMFQKNDRIEIWRKVEQIHLSDLGNFALVTSVNHVESLQAGQESLDNYFLTLLIEKIDRTWYITHMHQTQLEEASPTSFKPQEKSNEVLTNDVPDTSSY